MGALTSSGEEKISASPDQVHQPGTGDELDPGAVRVEPPEQTANQTDDTQESDDRSVDLPHDETPSDSVLADGTGQVYPE